MKAIIVSNGNIKDYSYCKRFFQPESFVIGADGGTLHLQKMGIQPDLLVGDFDSLPEGILAHYRDFGTEILKFPREKDMTDSELAADIAVNRGYKEILFLGGLGTRLDHSLSNIFLLKKLLDQGVRGILADEQNEIMLIRDQILLGKEPGHFVSLLPVNGQVTGVTTRGLYYPLKDATLMMGSTWGVSNEFMEDTAEITVKSGELLVIRSRD